MRSLHVWAAALLLGFTSLAANAAEPSSLEARLKRVEDHQAIERLLLEYGRTLDNRDFAAYSALFAENGEWSGGMGTFKGPAGIKAAMEKSFSTATDIPKGTNFHVLTNAIIDINGDRAKSLSKWAFIRMVDNKPEFTMAGRYEDELIREKGAWKFLKRSAPAATAPK
jgi:3-phenylpropionate/cinnamic acid dioxygenase small subunit